MDGDRNILCRRRSGLCRKHSGRLRFCRSCRCPCRYGESDLEPFLDYLVFPDASLGIALEHYLAQPLSAADITAIAAHLEQHINEITIHNGTQRIACPLPDDMWDTFLSRLHLADATVAALYDAAPQTVTMSPATITHTIRCTSLPATPLTTDILLRCLTRLPQHDPVFPLLLETLLSLLSSLPAKTACGLPPRIADLQAQLENSRRRLYKAILEAQEFAVKLQRFNMETLMMTGTIPPTINVDAARFQLRIIDRLAVALFGHLLPLWMNWKTADGVTMPTTAQTFHFSHLMPDIG